MAEDVPGVASMQTITFHTTESWNAFKAKCGNPQAWSDGKRSFFFWGGWVVYYQPN